MVFAPHNYHGSIDPGTVEQGFSGDLAAAQSYGTTMWIGEFGWFGTDAAATAGVAPFAAAQDTAMVGGTWWQWRQACGDPHSVGKHDGQPAARSSSSTSTGAPATRTWARSPSGRRSSAGPIPDRPRDA